MTISNQDVAEILQAIGGKQNISAISHCVTRLRLALHDESMVVQPALESNELVKGCFSTNGQFQIIIGPGRVQTVYEKMQALIDKQLVTKQTAPTEASKKLNPLQRVVKALADIFIPILPAIVAAGLLMGINNIFTGKGIFFTNVSLIEKYPQWADLTQIIQVIASTAFVFLSGLIGWSAVKKFGGSELLGIVLGLLLVHPSLLNVGTTLLPGLKTEWNVFGLSVSKFSYHGQVLPVLIAAYCLAQIERFLNKHIPDSCKLLLGAPIVLLTTGLLTFVIIGPITLKVSGMITTGLITVFEQGAVVGGLLYGGLYALLAVTGMHHMFLALDMQLISTAGGTFLWPIVALSNIAQGSAALAMMLITKDTKVRSLSLTASVFAYLGITELAMFGVNLRFRYPFIAAMIGAALGGGLLSLYQVKAAAIGIGGLPSFISIIHPSWGTFFQGMLIVLIVPFVVTLIIGKIKRS